MEILKKYLDIGFHLFPIYPNKKIPLTEHGFKDATNNIERVSDWFDRYPNANWAVATGSVSGIVCIDVDVSNGKRGDKNLKELIARYGDIPRGVMARSASGGFHCFYKYDEEKKPKKGILTRDVDFLADGSYVLIEPSKIEGRSYAWLNNKSPFESELEHLPDWVYELANGDIKDKIEFIDGKVPIGQRHAYLLSVGGALRRLGEGPELIKKALLIAYNERCSQGNEKEDPEKHIDRLAERLCRYEAGDPIILSDDMEITTKMKAIESEEQIIGFILNGKYFNDGSLASIFTILEPYHFLDQIHSTLYRSIKDLWKTGVTPNQQNVKVEVVKKDISVDLQRFVDDITIGKQRDLEYHLDNIIDSYKNREAARIFKQAFEMASRGESKSNDVISFASSKTLSLLNDSSENMVYDTEGQVELAREIYESALSGETLLNEPTGLISVDDKVLGFPRGEVTFIAGRPGHFKSALMLQFNRNINFRWKKRNERKCSAIFSAEMSAGQLSMRNVCSIGMFDTIEFRKGKVPRDQFDKALRIYKNNITTFIDQTPNPTGDYIISKTLAINALYPVGAVFFDFIGLSGESIENEILKLKQATEKLKVIAKLLNIPVIALSQIKRDIEFRNPPIPKESDLAWSDNLTQLANQIWFVIYPHKWWENGIIQDPEPNKNTLQLFLSKNRDGSIEKLDLIVYPEYGLIIDPRDYEMRNLVRREELFV